MKLPGIIYAFFLAALMGGVLSCKKEPIQYVFGGTVKESVHDAPLSGVTVEVSQRVYNGSVASSFFTAAGLATTASNGTYEIAFDREKVFEFKVEMTKSGYFDVALIMSSSEVSTEETKVVDETLEPKSWVQFHIKNIGGMSTDLFTMVHYNFRENCTGCTTNDYYYYEGIVDSTFTFTTTGGVYARYSYNNPGSANYVQDSVYAIPFDTAFVNINY